MQDVLNLDALRELAHLKVLSLEIFNMRDMEILNYNNLRNLVGLFISDTRSKVFNLDYLRKFKELKSLRIVGHTKLDFSLLTYSRMCVLGVESAC